MRKIYIFIVLINLWSCKNKEVNCDRSVAVFFNPSSLVVTNYHFIASTNKQIIIDTTLKSTSIDQSVLMKCFDPNKSNDLTVIINGKKRVIKLDSILRINGPTSVFTRCNNRIKLDSLFQSYTKKSIKTTGKIPVYKEFVDSLTAHNSATSKFDSLMIYVKKDKCWCDSHNH